jgi:neutral amino acid transport system permease protein
MVGYLIDFAIRLATFGLFSLGLNLQWGFTGLINFGHIAFMTLGAYATVLLSLAGLPLVLAALAGGGLAALLGLLIGFSTLRLREDYLAIVTIGVSEVIRLIALNEEELTKGTRGVYGYPLPLETFEPNLFFRIVMIGILAAVFGAALWKLWGWFGSSLKEERPRSTPLAVGTFVLYLVSLVALLGCLWYGFVANTGFLILGLLPIAVGMAAVYGRFQKPIQFVQKQSWTTHLAIASATLSFGLVGLLVWANIQGLWNYQYKAALLWLLVLLLAFVFWRLEALVSSPWGRVLKAIREDEEVAKALGKNAFFYKLQSLMLGGAIAGLAGSFYAWNLTFINPDGFIPLITFQAWIMVVLGGSGNNVGTLLGTGIFWIYDALTRFVLPRGMFDDAQAGAFRMMVIGLLLIILMMWRPQGIMGKKEELTLGR